MDFISQGRRDTSGIRAARVAAAGAGEHDGEVGQAGWRAEDGAPDGRNGRDARDAQDGRDERGGRGSRRAAVAVRQAMRSVATQLSLLNNQVGGHLELRPGDLYCLDLIDTHGPLSPTVLARMAGLHPATMTGVLDRLERGHWIVRERDPADRRAVLLRVLRERGAELLRLYSGMNDALDRICADYTPAELDLIADFLARAAQAGRTATEDLSRDLRSAHPGHARWQGGVLVG